MIFAIALSAVAVLAMLVGAHLRLTPKASALTPYALLCAGAVPLLVQHATSATAWGPSAVMLLAVLGALSLKVRTVCWGLPEKFRVPAGPSTADLAQLLAQQHAEASAALSREAHANAKLFERLHQALEAQFAQLGQQMRTAQTAAVETIQASQEVLQTGHQALQTSQHTLAAAIDTASGQTLEALAAFAREQEQNNHAILMEALSGVIADFNERINQQFDAHLAELAQTVGDNVILQDRHRAQQGEMMHHARRSADQMSKTTEAFRALVAESAGVASVGATIGEALDRLGPQQRQLETALQAIADDLAGIASNLDQLEKAGENVIDELTARSRKAIEAAGQRIGQQSLDLTQLVQRSSEQIRTQLGDAASKNQQQVAAASKELAESLNKALAALAKQLNATSSRLSNDLGPMAQQIKRVAEQSKLAR